MRKVILRPGDEQSSASRPNRLGFIPARSGSKRLPGKNTRPLGGHPLIAWTIRAALGARCFDRVIVSTDGAEIANIAIACGAEVPFLRPAELSTDETPTVDVVLHLLDALATDEGPAIGELCILQPTSPFRTAEDIVRSHDLFGKKEAHAVVSVAPCAHSPLWMNTLGAEGSMENFIAKRYLNKRSQELPVYHRVNGAIYWCDADVVRNSRTIFPDRRIYAYEMDELRSVDIDTLRDFEYAEFLLERGYVPPL